MGIRCRLATWQLSPPKSLSATCKQTDTENRLWNCQCISTHGQWNQLMKPSHPKYAAALGGNWHHLPKSQYERIHIWENWTHVSLQEKQNHIRHHYNTLGEKYVRVIFDQKLRSVCLPLGVDFNCYEGVVGCRGDCLILPAWHHLFWQFIISW